jgi:hypothetical protein
MKKRGLIVAIIFSALLLGGCGNNNTGMNAPSVSGDVSASESAGVKPVATEDEVRALYSEKISESGITIKSVTPYNGDFLVQYGLSGGPWFFDWVYGGSGERVKFMFCPYGVKKLEIVGPGMISVVTDGVSCIDGGFSFPSILTACTALQLDENGQPKPDEEFLDATVTQTYWADIGEASRVGTTNRKEAVINAVLGVAGLEMAFGPRANENGDGISDFTAAYCAPPETDITYNAASRVMTVTCHDTALKSGEVAFTNTSSNTDFEQLLARSGTSFPTEFPAGTLPGSNPLIEKAVIEENGSDTVVTLYLTEKATQYTVQCGYTGPDDMGPYIRIILRARNQQ